LAVLKYPVMVHVFIVSEQSVDTTQQRRTRSPSDFAIDMMHMVILKDLKGRSSNEECL